MPVRLQPYEWQELRLDSAVVEKQGGPAVAGGFALRLRLAAGSRVRCRKLSDDGKVEWLPVSIRPAGARRH